MSTKMPPVTSLMIFLLLLIFLIQILTDSFQIENHTLQPDNFWKPGSSYLLITSHLVHSNLFYLAASVIFIYFLGSRLEKKMGTMLFFWTQVLAWFGTAFMFIFLGLLLYFISDFKSWMKEQHTGYAAMILCLAVVDSYIGHRDMLHIALPWVLVPILPLVLPNVSVLSGLSGVVFGLLLTRGGLGIAWLPDRAGVIRSENSCLGKSLRYIFHEIEPAWPENSISPFEQSMQGFICSDQPAIDNPERRRLHPLSSKTNMYT